MLVGQPPSETERKPFLLFHNLPEVIRLAVVIYVRFPFFYEKMKLFCANVASTIVRKPFVIGDTGSARCSCGISGKTDFALPGIISNKIVKYIVDNIIGNSYRSHNREIKYSKE